MKREYKARPVSLADVMQKYLASLPLEQRLKAAIEYEERKQQEKGAADGVIDVERGWRLK